MLVRIREIYQIIKSGIYLACARGTIARRFEFAQLHLEVTPSLGSCTATSLRLRGRSRIMLSGVTTMLRLIITVDVQQLSGMR